MQKIINKLLFSYVDINIAVYKLFLRYQSISKFYFYWIIVVGRSVVNVG